jgi:hypothetical protein
MILFDSVEGLFDDQAGDFDDGGVVNATATVTGLQSTSAFASVSANGDQSRTATLTGLEAQSSIGTVSATGQSFAVATVTGVEGVSSIGTVIAIGEGDAIATVPGVSATSGIGEVSAVAQTIRKGRKSNAKFLEFSPRPVQVSISAVAAMPFVQATTSTGLVTVSGGVSAGAKLYAIEVQTDIQVVQAGGIINPTDEEIIFLMAA